jgi:hypothetical protein
MVFNLPKELLALSVLCLGFALIGTVVADDQSSNETYGAYPGAPTSVVGQPTQTPLGLATPVPAQSGSVMVQKSVTSVTNGKPVIQLGNGGRTSSTVSSSTVTAVYSTQAPPATQQNVLMSYNVQTAPPTAVYFSGTYMPWTSFYQVFPANAPALWVASSAGWSWYATCPVGGWVQDLMYVPYTGTMKLYEFYPDGTVKLYSYGFATPGYKYIWFYADTPGRHITLFTIYDKPSNYITIDVA